MTCIRCTSKLLKAMGESPPAAKTEPAEGDWYADLLWFDRRKCLLLTHAATLFSVFQPDLTKASLAGIGPLLVQLIERELEAEDLPQLTFGPLGASPFVVERTSSRSVLGSMIDMRYQIEAAVEQSEGLRQLDLHGLNRSLRRIPFSALKYERPIDLARAAAGRAAASPIAGGPSAPQPGGDRIDDLFDQFIADRRATLPPKELRNYETIIDLFRRSLNGYAYESLSQFDRKRWDRAHSAGDEDVFCKLFGADKIPAEVGAFAGYFMIRKVALPMAVIAATGRVTTDLLDWLVQQGFLKPADVAEAQATAQAAASDLPKADKLSRLLHGLAQGSGVDAHALADEDYVEDFLTISRVEPGELWFTGDAGEMGPLTVGREVSRLAEPGWSINMVMGRVRGRWRVVEVGSVYPG